MPGTRAAGGSGLWGVRLNDATEEDLRDEMGEQEEWTFVF